MRVMDRIRVTRAISWSLLVVAALVITVIAGIRSAPAAEAAIVRNVVVVGLQELNSSGQSGVAVLTTEGTGTRVVVSVNAGAAGVAQPIHIHSGTCSTLGGIVHSLTNVTNGSSSTLVNASLSSLLTGGFSINLHKSVAEVSVYQACGDIPNSITSSTVEVGTSASAPQKGFATIAEAPGGRTSIAMSITAPAVPSTSQPAGVFPGSCILPGTVEYSLTNVVNGRSVTVLDIPYMAFRATKHVINVQRSTTVSTSASCGEIPQATLPSIPRTVVVPLLDLNSGQAGVALLFSQGARTQVIISVNNVTALPQPAHIHAGSCDVLGGVTQPLNSVENGWSSTIVNASLVSLRAGGFAINIHKSAFEVSVYMACGDIPTADNSLTFRLAGTGTGAQVGYAGLVGAGDDTLVGVWVTPSSKGLAQPIHVHSGTCSSPGPITQPLTDLVDGRSVTRLAGVSMASLRDGSSIVNLHKSAAEISVYPACARVPALTPPPAFTGTSRAVDITAASLPNITISPNTRVTWTNRAATWVTVSANDNSFDSGVIPTGFTFSRTFTVTDKFGNRTATVTVR